MIVKGFLETFKNKKKKPGLIMKTSGAGFSILDREEILRKINVIKIQLKVTYLIFILYTETLLMMK